jgi:hypothetical protein
MPFLYSIFKLMDAMLRGAMGTTIENSIGFHAMTDNATGTMSTGWRQCMDGTLKTVEDMYFSTHVNFKTLIVRVTTHLTSQLPVILRHILLVHNLPLSIYSYDALGPARVLV